MSIAFTVGSYKDRADLQRQLDKYYKQLSLQASNNAKIKDIDNNSITRAELQLAPQFSQRNSEDKLKDSSYQRQLAYQKLSTIFSPKDVDSVMGDLIAKDEILLFNTYADKFFDDYKISANTTINMFLTNWKLFQEKLNNSDISTLGSTLTDIKSILEGSQDKLQEAIDEIKRSSLAAGEKSDAIKDILMTTYVRGQKKLNEILDAINVSSLAAGEKSDAIKDILMTTYVRGQKKLNDILDAINASSLAAGEKSALIGDMLTTVYVRNKEKLDEIISAINASSLVASEKATAIKTAIESSSLTASQKADAITGHLGRVEAHLGGDSGLSPDALKLALKLVDLDNKEVEEAYKDTFPKGVADVPSLYRGELRFVSKFRYPTDNDEDTMMKRNAILLNSFPDIRNIDWGQIANSKGSFRSRQNRNTEKLLGALTSVKDEMKVTQLLLAENGIKAGEIKQVLNLLRHSSEEQLQQLNDSIRENGIYARETSEILREMQGNSPPEGAAQSAEDYYHEITGYSEDAPEYDDEEKKAGEMALQNRDAREYLRNLINDFHQKSTSDFKRQITKLFNKELKDAEYVPTWSDRENRSAVIRRGNAGKYYKKIEAIILNRFPLATLLASELQRDGLFVPYRAEGTGIKMKIPRHKSAGRYLVHIPSLQKGYLYIQYPSAWRIKHFPKRAISSDMCDMVWDLVDDKQFNSKKYNKLKSEEKKLYDELIHMLRVPPEDVKGLRDHKKSTDKERDKCLKKLKILTGEINSGNHSKKTIKELKVLLLKMIDAGYISKAESNKIMYQIMVVDS